MLTTPGPRWRARGFGIDVDSAFRVAFLPEEPDGRGAPTRLETVGSVAELDRDWPGAEAERQEELTLTDGSLGLAIDHHPDSGYRLDAGVFGVYRLTPDGMRADCATEGIEPWRRDRFVTARVLPLAATLRGLEVLHGGCVAVGGEGVLFLGHSHAGKTSLTIQMVLRGASFLTDDLLAIQILDGTVVGHPGAALAGLRYAEHRLIPANDLALLGTTDDRGDKVWVYPERARNRVPLRAAYLLVRDPEADSLQLERVAAPDPRDLLAQSFFSHLALTPERLSNQLAVCSAIAASVPVIRAVIPTHVGADALAHRICEREGLADRRAYAA